VQDSASSRGEKIRVIGASTSSLLFETSLKYDATSYKVSILFGMHVIWQFYSEERCSICSIAYFELYHLLGLFFVVSCNFKLANALSEKKTSPLERNLLYFLCQELDVWNSEAKRCLRLDVLFFAIIGWMSFIYLFAVKWSGMNGRYSKDFQNTP
jgi:hypothetical protein